jgi:hypothetical protein
MEVGELKAERKEQADKITRMDLDGSVATKNFITNYNAEQAKQYDMLKHLSEQVSHLETMTWRLERLERKVDDGKPRREEP